MALTLRAGCWIKFWKCLARVICLYNYCNLFYPLLVNRYYDRFLPLFRQFLLLPNRSNKFTNLQANCSTLLTKCSSFVPVYHVLSLLFLSFLFPDVAIAGRGALYVIIDLHSCAETRLYTAVRNTKIESDSWATTCTNIMGHRTA